jgi:hypothetical protein
LPPRSPQRGEDGTVHRLGRLGEGGEQRSAWVRHLLDTDRPDLDGYLADVYPDGPAGPAN